MLVGVSIRTLTYMGIITMTEKITLGNRIKERRKARGYSLREFAEITGLTPGYLFDLEGDKFKSPGVEKLQAVAAGLETDLYELAGMEGLKRQCINCRYLETCKEMEGYGLCHRYPPHQMKHTKNPLVFEFPVVNLYWWCGEWKPKIVEVKSED